MPKRDEIEARAHRGLWERIERIEAERDRYREALERIAATEQVSTGGDILIARGIRDIARAALKDESDD